MIATLVALAGLCTAVRILEPGEFLKLEFTSR
jgi:hypothetical protein